MDVLASKYIYVDVPESPLVPGLRFRRPTGPADYAAMAALHAACAEADRLDEVVTPAEIANFFENPVGRDPALDTWVAEADGRVVAYSWINHRREAQGDEVHQHRGYVHPAFRGRGIGTALVRAAWGRLAERRRGGSALASVLSARVGGGRACVDARSRLHSSAVRVSDAARSGFTDTGAAPPGGPGDPAGAGRSLPRDLGGGAGSVPGSLGVRPLAGGGLSAIRSVPTLRSSPVASGLQGDQVARMVLSYINADENERFGRRRGYTEDIAVRRPWRRRGLASALIACSLAALKERGMSEAVLGVDAENRTGALRVYERLGFVTTRQWTLFRRPLTAAGQADG